MVGGISSFRKKPDLFYIVDIIHEKTALLEAIKCKVPVVAIIDTNANPELVDCPIPANDDAIKSVEMITKLIAEAVIVWKKEKKDEIKKETKKEIKDNNKSDK